MLRSLTAKQFAEWEIYASIDPFDELRQDYRVASIVQMIANVNRGAKQKAFKIEDFLLRFGGETEEKKSQSWQEQLGILKLLAIQQSIIVDQDEQRRKAGEG